MKSTIKDLVKDDNKAFFESYRQGFFYYSSAWYKEGSGEVITCTFPIPLEDIGTASFMKEMKSITLMRWIRKAFEEKTMIEYVSELPY